MANVYFDKHVVNLLAHLGQGVYGVVYKGEHKDTKQQIAAKRVSLDQGDKSDMFGETTMREIKALEKINRHPNIIHLIDYHYRQQCFWLIMEFCDKGDLQKYCKSNKPDIDFTITIVLQVASAVKFLHENNVIHRDIKPGNVLLQQLADGEIVSKLTDFGFSKMGDKSKSNEEWLLSSDVGTFAYKAPEFFADTKRYTVKVDTFSLGLLLLAMVQFAQGLTTELFPKSAKSLKKKTVRPVGQEMFDAFDDERPIPEIVQAQPEDGAKIKAAKELVQTMCTFHSDDRTPLELVVDTLARISGTHAPEIAGSGNVASDEPKEDLGLKFATDAINERFQTKVKELPDSATKQKATEIFTALALDEKLSFVVGIGMNSNEIKTGDKVRLNPDRATFTQLQEGFGGYQRDMQNVQTETGEVKRKVLHVFQVEFSGGKTFFFNENNLTKFSDEEFVLMTYNTRKGQGLPLTTLRKGDIVRIPENENTIRERNVSAMGGWNKQMGSSLGFSAIVRAIRENGAVTVRCINGEVWIFNPDILEKLDLSGVEMEVADLVMVTDDMESLETWQIGHGGMEPGMEKTLGKQGIVSELLSGGCIRVEIGGTKWTFNVQAVNLIAKGAEYMSAITKKSS